MPRIGSRAALASLGVALALTFTLVPAPRTRAADHADSPNVANDRAADLADTYIFLDPADNAKVVIMMTAQGFIVPGEAVNFVGFDPNIRYRFELETSGDARPDKFIDVRFTARTAANAPQMATITLPNNRTFQAPTTVPTLAGTPPPFVITSDATSMVDFFAGEVDDPFFFDIPGFARFRASVLAGNPDATLLNRGRDTFAGYNTMAIVMRMPVSLIGPSGNVIGINSVAQRPATLKLLKSGEVVTRGNKFINADRAGVPAVNALLIPFARKNEFNVITTQDDANGRFAGDIVAALTALGTNEENIGILASVAVTNGDMLRLDVTIANSGTGGGNNAGAGFPNGRRLQDDVVDTFLFFIANQNTLGDNVPANDVAFLDAFPFIAPPQQPQPPGVEDDNTRN
jgi:hypothetical protein